MELSAAEEYAIKTIAAESGMQRPVGEMPAAVSAAGEGNSALELGPGREHDPAVTFNSAPTIACAAEPALAIPDGLWPAVRAELVAQSVIGYPAHAVESLSLNPADQAEYLALAGKNLSSWYSLMMAQDDVLAEFRAAGIPVVVLKGAAAAAHYPQPNSRSMGDIDLIVPPDHFEQAFSLMERLGWNNDIELEINPRHAASRRRAVPKSSCIGISAHAPTSSRHISLTRPFTTPSRAPNGPMSQASACPCCRRSRTAWCCSRMSTSI